MAKTIRQALRGRSDFVSDIYIKGMLYATTVRSPYPRARLLSIDASDLPDDVTVLTAEDIPGRNELCIDGECMPILARDECRYAGEAVALIAGPSQMDVVAASRRLSVEYDELSAALQFPTTDESQTVRTVSGLRGDANTKLASSHQVVQGTYQTGIQEHMYNEPQGAVADPQPDGTIAVQCATQWPYHVRQTVAENLSIKPDACVVSATDTGVDLDGKLWYPSLVATHAALMAQKTGVPVKLVYSNLEDYQFTTKRAPVVVTHLTGIDETGTVTSARVDISYNCGAYPLFTKEMTDRLAATALGLYDCDDVSVSVRVVSTNLPPLNVLSGFGTSATHFAAETHAARIIEITGADPVQWRLDRLAAVRTGVFKAQTKGIMSAIASVVDQSDFSRKAAACELQKKRRGDQPRQNMATRGIGLAIAAEGNGFAGTNESGFASGVSVQLGTDGTAVVRTSTVPRSATLRDYWSNLVSEGLGLERSQVRIESGRTGTVPDSGPSTLSRSIAISGKLITQVCATIQRRRFRSPLPIEVKRSYRVPKNAAWDSATLSGYPFPHQSLGAVVVEVSVDPVTFESHVEDIWLSVDAGRVIDEDQARRSLEMGVYQALEWTTHEIIRFTRGAIDARSYQSYRHTNDPVRPGIHITFLPSTVREPRGVGSLPYNCIPAALAAAVSQATGRYMDRIPTNPELIHGYMEDE
jgi:CO/xanthine dehydrogenase Mo-binding subunit